MDHIDEQTLRDARRYRYLRNCFKNSGDHLDVVLWNYTEKDNVNEGESLRGAALDDKIDEQMGLS